MKTIEQFDLAASSISAPTWAYLCSLEWISAKENLTLIGPAGTGKSHALIALGHAAVHSGLRVGFVAAAHERRSLASHWPFEEWGRFLPDHRTAVSLLDRLLHHNNVVATDGESYRMREARTRSGGRPSKR